MLITTGDQRMQGINIIGNGGRWGDCVLRGTRHIRPPSSPTYPCWDLYGTRFSSSSPEQGVKLLGLLLTRSTSQHTASRNGLA